MSSWLVHATKQQTPGVVWLLGPDPNDGPGAAICIQLIRIWVSQEWIKCMQAQGTCMHLDNLNNLVAPESSQFTVRDA